MNYNNTNYTKNYNDNNDFNNKNLMKGNVTKEKGQQKLFLLKYR